jgi:ubiquinone biosynthesis protein COQ4
MRNLLRDKEDTRQVFILMQALRGKTTLRQLDRFRRTETGRAVLADRRRLLDRLTDRTALAALPPGTLGHTYYEFMTSENLSAEGLVEVSGIPEEPLDDIILFRERNREMHDLLHVVAGYGRDPLGEACVVAFSYAQTGQRGFAVIAFFAALNIARALPSQPVRRAVLEAYRRGRAARWLIGADWERLLAMPVSAIRDEFGVRPATYYPRILGAVRQAPGAMQAQPAATHA